MNNEVQKMIRLILLTCVLVFAAAFSAHGQSRDVYTINGIAVDERAPTVGEAQIKAFSAAKIIGARRLIERLTLPVDEIRTRRFRSSKKNGLLDPRAILRKSMVTGGDLILPQFRERRRVQPPLVVLADISGSMSQYPD